MALAPENAAWFANSFARIADNVGLALIGKGRVIRLAVTCMLAEGHLLLEDAPGTGKTALARALAATVDGSYNRIQFTPDLLPTDITGSTVLDQTRNTWEFRRGAIFASIVLADEINRASPKTQSALLEAMEESHVTFDGVSYDLGRPFMVIATQNPIEQAGTYLLPEAQLDRFLMKTSVGFPDRAAAVQVLAGSAHPDRAAGLHPIITSKAVAEMADLVRENDVDTAVLDYVAHLAETTRDDRHAALGVSTRGAIAIVRAARVWAAAHGRNYVLADDIKELAGAVWTHRIVITPEAEFAGETPAGVLQRALDTVRAPLASVAS